MSYVKAKILDVTRRADRQTGELVNRVQLEVISNESSRLPNDAGVLQAYEQAKGKTMLVPAEFRVIEGRSFLVLTGDGYPNPFHDRSAIHPQPDAPTNEPEKPKSSNPLFGGSK